MALSASPEVPVQVQDALRAALLDASKNPQGQKVLENARLPGFEAATAATYSGYDRLLSGIWGY